MCKHVRRSRILAAFASLAVSVLAPGSGAVSAAQSDADATGPQSGRAPIPGLVANAAMAASRMKTLAASVNNGIALAAEPITVTLVPPSSAGAGSLASLIARLRPGETVYLVVKGARTDMQPEILYRLYLGLPPGTPPSPENRYYVGTLSFFNAAAGAESDRRDASRLYSYPVTDLLKSLAQRGELGDGVTVTIAPSGKPSADAKPQIGEITLVRQ